MPQTVEEFINGCRETTRKWVVNYNDPDKYMSDRDLAILLNVYWDL